MLRRAEVYPQTGEPYVPGTLNVYWTDPSGPRHRALGAAPVRPIRQRTQYSCMAASLSMALEALGIPVNEAEVAKIMQPDAIEGASWDQMILAGQHFGARCTLIVPATIEQLKTLTDRGLPVVICWTPRDRPWSHASVVFDVDDNGTVYVADPNLPDPSQTVIAVPRSEFYGKWFEGRDMAMTRRPALVLEREIDSTGRAVFAGAPRALRGLSMEPRMCPQYVDPVCGADGKIYPNECQLAAAGVPLAEPGVCQAGADAGGGLPTLTGEGTGRVLLGQTQASSELPGWVVPSIIGAAVLGYLVGRR